MTGGRAVRGIAAELVALPYRMRLGHLGRRPRLFPPLLLRGANRILLGDDARLEPFAGLSALPGGRLEIGSQCEVSSFARIDADTGSIVIGDHSSVNSFCLINGFGGVRIGSGVRIASHCVILSSTHHFRDPTLSIHVQGVAGKETVIGDDVWLGAHTVVVAGVEVGAHSVVGAGSIVLADIPPYSVAAGAPARVIRRRDA